MPTLVSIGEHPNRFVFFPVRQTEGFNENVCACFYFNHHKGSTDAARGAADIVLTREGLSTIVGAINRSRQIFRRLEAYVIYRLASSVLILGFFFISIIGKGGSMLFVFGVETYNIDPPPDSKHEPILEPLHHPAPLLF